MRGLLTIAFVGLLPLSLNAQWHGADATSAPMRPAVAVRMAPMARPFAVRPAAVPVRGGFHFRPGVPGTVAPLHRFGRPGFRRPQFRFGFGVGRYPFGVPPQNRCFSDAFFDPFFCTRRPVNRGSFAFGAYPFFSYPVLADYSSDDESAARAEQLAQANAQANAQVSDLNAQIEQLREELRQMQEQQSAPPSSPVPAPQALEKQEPPAPTTLVFRDGRRSEVQNYAIVGDTLWVFSDQRAKKIPVASLDIRATQQVNEDRGVDFAVPPSAK